MLATATSAAKRSRLKAGTLAGIDPGCGQVRQHAPPGATHALPPVTDPIRSDTRVPGTPYARPAWSGHMWVAHERARERLNSVTGFPAPLRILYRLTSGIGKCAAWRP
jgi:hypothetical protein